MCDLGKKVNQTILSYNLGDVAWCPEAKEIIYLIGGGVETKDIANFLGWSNSNTSLKIKKIKDFISMMKKHELSSREFTIICHNFYNLSCKESASLIEKDI